MLSRLFIRRASTPPRFAAGLFVGLFALFALMAWFRPAAGLAGLGTVVVLGAVLIELNARRIWDEYRKSYKKTKGSVAWWHEPRQVYYTINVVIVWPLIAILGVLCLWTSYVMAADLL
jgi:hypothetical protein